MKLKEAFEPRCIHRHTARTHPSCFKEGVPVQYILDKPSNVLVLDIETLPILAYVWNVWNVDISPIHIEKHVCLLSYSAKWLDDDRIISDVLTPKEAKDRNDKRIAEGMWKLIDAADAIITHNGKRFDIRQLNARFWKHHLHRPSSYKLIDTLTAAKSAFGLTYNSLSFIAAYKELQGKLDTDFELWRQCDRGDRDSLQYMRDYNEQDVFLQEQVYMEMRDWIPNHPNFAVLNHKTDVCPVCLSARYESIGMYTTNKLQYPEYRCSDCGSTWHDTKVKKE
jgi:hypothetical protein